MKKRDRVKRPTCPVCRGPMRRIQLRPAKYSCGVCPALRAEYWLDFYRGPFGFVPEIVANVRREQRDEWPSWCFAPLGVFDYALRVFERMAEDIDGEGACQFNERAAYHIGPIGAVYTWRATKGVYRFHAEVADAVMETSLAAIPTDVLFRMPEWCPYVEFPAPQVITDFGDEEIHVHGFFAYLDSQDTVSPDPILRLALDAENLTYGVDEPGRTALLCVPVVLEPGASFDEACRLGAVLHAKIARHLIETGDSRRPIGSDPQRIAELERIERGAQEDLPPGMRAVMRSALSLLLYLCADQAEIPGRVEPLPTRYTVRPLCLVPKEATVYPCGMQLGASLGQARRAREENVIGNATGRRQAPHIRSAHWHTFWTGPRDGERVAVVRWLPPIAVNVSGDAPAAATIHLGHE